MGFLSSSVMSWRRGALPSRSSERCVPVGWPDAVGELKVRMGLHVGHIERQAHGYVGLEIHRAARVAAAAHGGQLLLTGVAAELLSEVVPSQPLGAHRFKDFPAAIALYCAVIDGRGAATFPPPRTLEVRAGNLPATTVGLVGREADLERVREALRGRAAGWSACSGAVVSARRVSRSLRPTTCSRSTPGACGGSTRVASAMSRGSCRRSRGSAGSTPAGRRGRPS